MGKCRIDEVGNSRSRRRALGKTRSAEGWVDRPNWQVHGDRAVGVREWEYPAKGLIVVAGWGGEDDWTPE